MPYPNEHAFRLVEPDNFIRFRRENNKLGSGIDVIWGVPKQGAVEIQAIRFKVDEHTYKDAKKWIKAHGYEPILSEKAGAMSNPVAQHIKIEVAATAVLSQETLDSYEDIYENNLDYFGEVYSTVFREALAEGVSEAEAEEMAMSAEGQAGDELYSAFQSALESTIESVIQNVFDGAVTYEPHGRVELYGTPEQFEKAAAALYEVMTGTTGIYYDDGWRGFMETEGIESPREMVGEMIGWVRNYAAVYGGRSPDALFDYHLEQNVR